MRHFITILVLVSGLTSCCDKEHTYSITSKTREYFDFGEGSIWVLENYADSTDVDTLVLTDKDSDFVFSFTESECDGDYHESITYKLVSKRYNDTLHASITTGPNSDIYSLQGNFHNLYLFCSHTIDKKDLTFSVNDYAHDTLSFYNSYTIKSKTFTDVVRMVFTQLSPAFPERAPSNYYARNVGLIEFLLFDEMENQHQRFWVKDYNVIK